MIIATGIAYPLLLVMIGEITLPFQSNGSLLTLDGKVVGSKLIAQNYGLLIISQWMGYITKLKIKNQ